MTSTLNTLLSSSSTGSSNVFQISRVYDYTPTQGLVIAACIIFALQSLIILYQAFKSRAYLLLWVALFTAAESFGYLAFILLLQTPSLNLYLGELILLILAPNIVSLCDYSILSRILPHAGFTDKSFFSRMAPYVPYFFVGSDLICLALQGAGGSQLTAANKNGVLDEKVYNLGRNLTLIGVSAQMLFQFLFSIITLYVYLNMPNLEMKRRLKHSWNLLLITVVLVYIRNIYRLIEFASGDHSSISATEVPYFVLDTLMMIITGCVFICLNIGDERVMPSELYMPSKAVTDVSVDLEAGKKLSDAQVSAAVPAPVDLVEMTTTQRQESDSANE